MDKLLLADDHDLVREALSEYLRREGGFDVAQANSFETALAINAAQGPFRLILLDFKMPGMEALDGVARMQAEAGCPVAILSGTAPPDVARRALRAGAAGFVPKTLTPQAMLSAVRQMMTGQVYLPLEFLADSDTENATVQLTPRERDVLLGVTEGKLNKEIARDLDIQEVTVKLHVKTLSRKLGAKNRTHAAMLARDLGLV
ncbi:response regulator transcription factor [Roseovarius aestuariivivens]|uniref:response regulator transcription factor n=1 Tax=Roseovarius aestuariivivens TaxID=1888910 RepID=UPI001080572F|nr:response regulator transcription factor [Roseovarius aestuariivivens]